MGYDPAVCLQNLNAKKLLPACQNLITPFHCDDVTGLDPGYHQTCADAGLYYFPIICAVCLNGRTNEYRYFPSLTFFRDCGALYKQDQAWEPSGCYCCCSCLANDTLVAVPGGVAPIYTIARGASVMAGSVATSDAGVRLSWSEAKVRFSQGTGSGGHQPMMVYVTFGPDSNQELICNTDQPFLLADGKYTTGGKLRPGQKLVGGDGQPLEVQLVSIGSYEGGVHHLATDSPWTGSPDGHLLLAGGVVAGDWAMQMQFAALPASMKEDSYDALPVMGTQDYDSAHAATVQRSNALFAFVRTGMDAPAVGHRALSTGVFKTYRTATAELPYGAQALLTQEQATSIIQNPEASQAPLGNPIPRALFNSVRAQLTGFYPDIVFYYDALDVLPNVYAFEAYGQKIVQVSGGLARMPGFNYEGIFMAMARGAACFYAGEPTNAQGYPAVGQADAYAFGVISRLCWMSKPYLAYVMEAMNQWQALFALVDPKYAGGTPGDPLNDPSLACRFQTIQAAAAGGGLLECAGGKPQPKISLENAATSSLNNAVLTFSLALDPSSASTPANYVFSPAAKVTSAQTDPTTGFIVHLEVALARDTSYHVTVQNLTSILGTGLDPDHTSVPLVAHTV